MAKAMPTQDFLAPWEDSIYVRRVKTKSQGMSPPRKPGPAIGGKKSPADRDMELPHEPYQEARTTPVGGNKRTMQRLQNYYQGYCMRLIGHENPLMLSVGEAKVPYGICRPIKPDAAYF